MSTELVIEVVLAFLLVSTCAYCFVLSRRLRILRDGQQELLSLIGKFDKASQRAEKNLAAMQSNGVAMSRDLDHLTARAHSLLDELSVMVHAGDHIAGRIEGAVNEVRAIGRRRAANDRRKAS